MKKPLDLGNGLVCASLDEHGAWLSLGSAHSRHGFVELTGLPPFDEEWRGDPVEVRRYRQLMTDSRYAFLRLEVEGWSWQHSESAPEGGRTLEQRVVLSAAGPAPPQPVLRFRGRIDRPAFAEITEVTPLPRTGASTELRSIGQTLRITAAALPAVAEIQITCGSSAWEITDGGARLAVGKRAAAPEVEILVTCSLVET